MFQPSSIPVKYNNGRGQTSGSVLALNQAEGQLAIPVRVTRVWADNEQRCQSITRLLLQKGFLLQIRQQTNKSGGLNALFLIECFSQPNFDEIVTHTY